MDALMEMATRIGPRAERLAKRANAMEKKDLSRGMAAWDFIELAAIQEHDKDAYLDRAEEILDGATYTS